MAAAVAETTLRFEFDEEGFPRWTGPLPPRLSTKVASQLLKVAAKVAKEGIGEEQKACGFILAMVLNVAAAKKCGDYSDTFNTFGLDKGITLEMCLTDKQAWRFLVKCFVADKAVVVLYDGTILADGYQVKSTVVKGGTGESAGASIGAAGYLAIKVSADDCGPGPASAHPQMKVFAGSETATYVPVWQKPLSAQEAEMAALQGKMAQMEIEKEQAAALAKVEKLCLAVEGGSTYTVDQLIKEGTDVNGTDSYGCTPLMKAALEGHSEVATLLLEKGASKSINQKNKAGFTALGWAARAGHSAVVQQLVDAGASHTIKDEDGKTALDYARDFGKTECVGILEKLDY